MKTGIIGLGVVGSAVKLYLEKFWDEPKVFDVDRHKCNCPYKDILDTEVVFVSVPTPYNKALKDYDLSALHKVLQNINEEHYMGVVVHKCTVLPKTTEILQRCYPNLKLVHFPEFLTQANATKDFANQKTILLSGKLKDCQLVEMIFQYNFKMLYSEDYAQTEMAKLIHNSFLATKVSFFNEMFKACERLNISYQSVIQMAQEAQGIGSSHTSVPGPDGKFGFGGACFVKDSLALTEWGKRNEISLSVLNTAIELNKKIRPSAYDGTEKTGIDALSEI